MKTQNWQGNGLVFPTLITVTIVLGNAHVLKKNFLCVSSRLKSVAVVLAQAHPTRCFCQKLFTFRDQNAQETTRSGKTGTCQNHMTNCEKTTKFNATKKYKKYSLTYKTYSQTYSWQKPLASSSTAIACLATTLGEA
jgi:hypothetical protein